MAATRTGGPRPVPVPNQAMRELRGALSPGEFATLVRRAAREIGEHVSCDARYVGRVESGEIRCPNYAYERVFRHLWPEKSLAELGFAPRTAVRRRAPATEPSVPAHPPDAPLRSDEENDDVLRRTFLNGGPTALAAVLGLDQAPPSAAAPLPAAPPRAERRRIGAAEVEGVEQAVRDIRLLDDAHGADTLFELAGQSLRSAYVLLNDGEYNAATERRLQGGAGELAISVGWLAHDSNRLTDARSFYSEALATARMARDPHLEAHVFSNSAFLARDAGRPREALRAAQAGQAAADGLGSDRLLSLLALREAGGWALLGDRSACERALARAYALFDRGGRPDDPEWMSFFGEAELAGQEAQCWSALGEWDRASVRAERAIGLQEPHFVRNRVLYTAELAHDRLGRGDLAGAAEHGAAAVALLDRVRSARVRGMLARTADRLRGHAAVPEVRDFLDGYDAAAA
ncbi:tetratricopeptide repeat protein [Kitasatospora fiedleri]|uniref:tetratricopeptide repeat protein n=1 Tax=Kitasatospora fiedleri TaxID=2991545 RepID=UPI00249AA7B0|nr:tetratricopeptide repeat protein [Kitasatospora fiedleri]